MIVFRQFHDGIAYDKREPFTIDRHDCHIHGLVLFTDTDPRMQPPEWDRKEHYRVGVVIKTPNKSWPFPTGGVRFWRDGIYTFKMWLEKDGKEVRFDNNAVYRPDGINTKPVTISPCVGRQDVVFAHVIHNLMAFHCRND